jgi:perosamine synthetase
MIAEQYGDLLKSTPVEFQQRRPGLESGEWLVSVLLPEDVDRDKAMQEMEDDGIETRPLFYCAHQMPMYDVPISLPIAEGISRRGISLPSYPQMSERDVERTAAALRRAIKRA